MYGFERRLQLIHWAAQQLAPGGLLCVSLWDFGAHERWARKTLPWENYAERWGLSLEELEDGDTLFGWQDQVDTPRYCHWVSPNEEQRIFQALNPVLGMGWSHCVDGDLNRYICWRSDSN